MFDRLDGQLGWWKVVPEVRHLLWVWEEAPPVRGIEKVVPFTRLGAHCVWHLLSGHAMMRFDTADGTRFACSKCEFKA